MSGIFQCHACGQVWQEEMKTRRSESGLLKGWEPKCLCGSIYMDWMNYQEFAL